jgi:hypothetical protein
LSRRCVILGALCCIRVTSVLAPFSAGAYPILTSSIRTQNIIVLQDQEAGDTMWRWENGLYKNREESCDFFHDLPTAHFILAGATVVKYEGLITPGIPAQRGGGPLNPYRRGIILWKWAPTHSIHSLLIRIASTLSAHYVCVLSGSFTTQGDSSFAPPTHF